jgi:ferredoxin-NADP reductase
MYAYLAVAFGYLHQLTVGTDFTGDPLATWFWIGLYVASFAPLLLYRIAAPILLTLRHRPRVAAVVGEADGVFSLYVTGEHFERLAVRSGQFFVVRALTLRDWLHGHPFSISAAPNGRYLRFTVKELGAGTRELRALRAGTRLFLEGPYGAVHGARRTGRKLLLIAGGIGIAPIRALAEGFGYRPGDVDLVYRTRVRDDAALRGELEALAAARGLTLHLVAGRRGDRSLGRDPLGPQGLLALVPDAASRDVFLCGPDSLVARARSALLRIGTDPARIHLEAFG